MNASQLSHTHTIIHNHTYALILSSRANTVGFHRFIHSFPWEAQHTMFGDLFIFFRPIVACALERQTPSSTSEG